MTDYYFTVVCSVDPSKLPPVGDDDSKLLSFNDKLNAAVASEKAALKAAVEKAINEGL